MNALLIFLGGGLGAVSRWGLSEFIHLLAARSFLPRFPFGILFCNLLGCFLIGCLFGFYTSRNAAPWVFPFLATGFLGGFTTFSTFAKDSTDLWSDGLFHLALAKVLASVILGILAVVLGMKLTS